MIAEIGKFFDNAADSSRVTNERSLQLELAYTFRSLGYSVRFEVPLRAPRLAGSSCKPKSYLDLLIDDNGIKHGIELKVPMNGQHPETMYAFCADLEFMEAIKRNGDVNHAYCLLLTSDKAFWYDSGRGSPIHNLFRREEAPLTGLICKPTGANDTSVHLSGQYYPASCWKAVGDKRLMPDARYLLIEV